MKRSEQPEHPPIHEDDTIDLDHIEATVARLRAEGHAPFDRARFGSETKRLDDWTFYVWQTRQARERMKHGSPRAG